MGDGRQQGANLWAHIDDRDHVRQLSARRYTEPAVSLLNGTSGRKGTKGLALLDHGVDAVAHLGVAWIGEDASIAESTRAVFHAATIPGDDSTVGNETGCGGTGFFERMEAFPLDSAVEALQSGLDLGGGVARTKERCRQTVVGNWTGKRGAIECGAE